MTDLCIGLLCYCDSNIFPERFEILKRCINSLSNIKEKNVYIYAIDNGSSAEVINFLNSSENIDDVHQSSKNLYDVVAVHLLSKKAKNIGAKYVMHLEDDFLFYGNNFLNSALTFLNKNLDCGYLRILKYDYDNKSIYDKFSGVKNIDKANAQRHYNTISKEQLVWQDLGLIDNFRYFKTNWHWYNYANICRSKVFEKIIPYEDCHPLQSLEGYMMRSYQNLNLMTGVMNMGVVSHEGVFNKKTSQRYAVLNGNLGSESSKLPLIKFEDVQKELKVLI
jgi:hypothetical protein